MKLKLIGIFAVILVLGLVLMTSCAQQKSPTNTGQTGQVDQTQTTGSGNTGSQQGQTAGAKTYTVDIQGFAFNPPSLKINKGDTVVWTNKDSAPHTVVSDSGDELASDSLSNGQTYSHTFNQAGTFNYHCGVHLAMKASVEVV